MHRGSHIHTIADIYTAPKPMHVPQTHSNMFCTDTHIDPAANTYTDHIMVSH